MQYVQNIASHVLMLTHVQFAIPHILMYTITEQHVCFAHIIVQHAQTQLLVRFALLVFIQMEGYVLSVQTIVKIAHQQWDVMNVLLVIFLHLQVVA